MSLGIACVCQQLGLASWLDALAPQQQRGVRYGTATVAMILNGLGCVNCQRSLVPQFFEKKPVERLLGEGIMADMRNDDSLGRALDWLYEQDVPRVFAGLAHQARHRFALPATRLHVDTTSFSVSGDDQASGELVMVITSGYARDHREDLKPWMLALATTHQGDIPLYLQLLSGNSSEKASLIHVIEQLQPAEPEEHPISVADSGRSSAENMPRLQEAKIDWASRVPETSQAAKAALQQEASAWQQSANSGNKRWHSGAIQQLIGERKERWLVVRTPEGIERARQTATKQAHKQRELWQQKLWHVSKQPCACQADAMQAWGKSLKSVPAWLNVQSHPQSPPIFEGRGRLSRDHVPSGHCWQVPSMESIDEEKLQAHAEQKACFIVARNGCDEQRLSHEELIALYLEQGSVERGLRFLKDPLFLASCVCEKARTHGGLELDHGTLVVGVSADRTPFAYAIGGDATMQQTIPHQVNKPTARPTMRWVFQRCEGMEVLHMRMGDTERPYHPVVGAAFATCNRCISRCSPYLDRPLNNSLLLLSKLRNVG